jgi:hypothetical protein
MHTFSLISDSEEQRESWISALRANRALAEVASAIMEDVIKVMLWDMVNTSDMLSTNPPPTPVRRATRVLSPGNSMGIGSPGGTALPNFGTLKRSSFGIQIARYL